MNFDITIGSFRLTMLDSVEVTRSVENLADTAVITLPGTAYNRALEVEDKISEGDPVCIRFGYDADTEELPVEFEGYVDTIATEEGSIKITCEDELYAFRKEVRNTVLTDVSAGDLLSHVASEIGGFDVACDYDFRYDKFTIYECGNLRELCAVAYSEIESVRFHQGDTTITADGEKTEVVVGGSYILVNNGKIKLFGGKENKEKNKEEENDKSNGGLVKVKELTSKINALEASLNDLKSVFGTWTPAAQDGGAALKGAITDWASKELTVTQRTDIENPKVTH